MDAHAFKHPPSSSEVAQEPEHLRSLESCALEAGILLFISLKSGRRICHPNLLDCVPEQSVNVHCPAALYIRISVSGGHLPANQQFTNDDARFSRSSVARAIKPSRSGRRSKRAIGKGTRLSNSGVGLWRLERPSPATSGSTQQCNGFRPEK